jgi:hypothetical protein
MLNKVIFFLHMCSYVQRRFLTLHNYTVSDKAHSGECAICQKALLYHYLYVARASINFSVFLQTKGVFWAGDNQVYNMGFVNNWKEDIISEYLSHPKSSWQDPFPIYTQYKEQNINVQGALHIARQFD